MPLSQQDEFGGSNWWSPKSSTWSQCRSRSKMNSEHGRIEKISYRQACLNAALAARWIRRVAVMDYMNNQLLSQCRSRSKMNSEYDKTLEEMGCDVSQCRSRSKMNSEKRRNCTWWINQRVSMPLSQQDEFGVTFYNVIKKIKESLNAALAARWIRSIQYIEVEVKSLVSMPLSQQDEFGDTSMVK